MIGTFARTLLLNQTYDIVKDVALEYVDCGGFGAFCSDNIGVKLNVLRDCVSNTGFTDQLSNLKTYTISTLNTGLIKVKSLIT